MSFPRYEDYHDSGLQWLGKVPKHWKLRRLGYFFGERREKVSDRVYQPLSVTKEGIVPQLETAAKTDDGDNRKKVCKGDFVINSRSDRKGSAGLSELDGSVSLISTVLKPQESVHGPYVHHLLRCIPFQEEFYRFGKGIVADLWSTNYTSMSGITLAMPPVSEQHEIAKFLDRETAKIDALIAEQQRLIELLQEKRQAVISHAVTKGLNPNAPMKESGVEWLREVPEHWKVKASRHIALVGRGASPRPAGDPRFFGGDFIPWVTVAEITKDENIWLKSTEEHLTKEGAINSSEFAAGTVLYSNSGATLGVPKISRMNCCANDGVVGFRNLSPEVTPEFLYYYLYQLTGEIREWAKQGQGQPNLNTDIIKSIQLALPPLDEQRQIVDSLHRRLKQSDSLLNDVVSAQALLAERRSALISAAVTGHIDVRGLATEEEP
jgi:type I restriction enzyme S subunit